jgi:hypothetical protein
MVQSRLAANRQDKLRSERKADSPLSLLAEFRFFI